MWGDYDCILTVTRTNPLISTRAFIMPAGIKALPASTVRLVASSQVLTTPVSLIKELVDNAIDAKATSVDISISVNTIDKIEVRDNGQGIARDDLDFLGKRGYTSKLRSFEELKTTGGASLGFRGEALASAAELGQVSITTRTEGEAVAASVRLKIGGGIESQNPASHPIGTTVAVSNLFSRTPVRKQNVLKQSTKNLAIIKDLLQDYAFARLHVRFSLKVLKSSKGNWTFAPRRNDGIKEITSQVIGRETAGQCTEIQTDTLLSNRMGTEVQGSAGMSTNGCLTSSFVIQAFIPKSTAEWSKIGGGPHISIDSRPVTSKRGAPKKILAAYKLYLRNSLPKVVPRKVRDPFIWLNIICPVGSYDPNVEPSKDNLIFDEERILIASVLDVFKNVYGELNGAESQKVSEYDLERKTLPLDDGVTDIVQEPTVLSPTSPTNQNCVSGSPDKLDPWVIAKLNAPAVIGARHRDLSEPVSKQRFVTQRSGAQPPNSMPQRILMSSFVGHDLPTPRSTLSSQETPSVGEQQESLDTWLDSIPVCTHRSPSFTAHALIPGTPPPHSIEERISSNDKVSHGTTFGPGFVSARQLPLTAQRAGLAIPAVVGALSTPDSTRPSRPSVATHQASIIQSIPWKSGPSANRNGSHSMTRSNPSAAPASIPAISLLPDQDLTASALDIEESLDYEKRKEEATKKRRAILRGAKRAVSQLSGLQRETQRSSPHTNRYIAAVATLDKHRSPAHMAVQDISEAPFKTSQLDGDPQAYLMRRKKSMSTTTEGTLKRSKTHFLPLESIPRHSRLHRLVQPISIDVDKIRRDWKKVMWDDEVLRSDAPITVDDGIKSKLSVMVSAWCQINNGEEQDVIEDIDVQSISGEV